MLALELAALGGPSYPAVDRIPPASGCHAMNLLSPAQVEMAPVTTAEPSYRGKIGSDRNSLSWCSTLSDAVLSALDVDGGDTRHAIRSLG